MTDSQPQADTLATMAASGPVSQPSQPFTVDESLELVNIPVSHTVATDDDVLRHPPGHTTRSETAVTESIIVSGVDRVRTADTADVGPETAEDLGQQEQEQEDVMTGAMGHEFEVPRVTRPRKMTQKMVQHQQIEKEKELQFHIKRFHKTATKIEDNLADCDDTPSLITFRKKLDHYFGEVEISFDNYLDIHPTAEASIDDIKTKYTRIKQLINKAIKSLQREKNSSSHRSSRSGSRRSTRSLKAEELARSAELKARLQFLESGADSELKRLQIRRDLTISEARLSAIKFEESQTLEQMLEDIPTDDNRVEDFVKATAVPQTTSLQLNMPLTAIQLPSVIHSEAIPLSNVNAAEHSLPMVTNIPKPAIPFSAIASVVTTTATLTTTSTTVTPSCLDVTWSATRPRMTGATLPTQYKPASVIPDLPSVIFHPPVLKPYALPSSMHNLEAEKPGKSEETSRDVQLLEAVCRNNKLSRLPPPDPGVFNGDPLKFPSWLRAFTALVDQCGIEAADKLWYISQYTTPEARECIQGLLDVPTDGSYEQALAALHNRYGQQFVVANAYRDKLENHPKIKGNDAKSLRKFSDFLRQCLAMLSSIDSLYVLDDARQNRMICSKLPDWLRRRWAKKATTYRDTYNQFPPFATFVQFISTESDIACDPILSLPSTDNAEKTEKENRGKPPKKYNAKTFNTQTKEKEVQEQSTDSKETATKETDQKEQLTGKNGKRKFKLSCHLCKEEHYLSRCADFKKLSVPDRRAFVDTMKLCCRCLNKGHDNNDCTKTMIICTVCNGNHNTLVHMDNNPYEYNTPGRNPDANVFTPDHHSSNVHYSSSS